MTQIQLAKILSIILGPVWLSVFMIIVFLNIGLTIKQIELLLPSLILLQIVVPIATLYFGEKYKLISAWDIPIRRERFQFLLLVLFCNLVALGIVYFYGNPLAFKLNLIAYILTATIAIITLFWKISIHATLNTLAALYINFLFDWKYPYLFLTIPAIFWARLVLRRHTPLQLLTGFAVTSLIVILGLRGFF